MIKKFLICTIVFFTFMAVFPAHAKYPICATVEKCMPFAEQGNPSAQTTIGFYYDKGERVKQDKEKALYWYRKAAEQGYAAPQFNIGKKYYNGDGVEQDYKQAYEWFLKAANQNYWGANILLGIMYLKGSGVTINPIKSIQHFLWGLIYLIPFQIILVLLPVVLFLCWKSDKKYSGDANIRENKDAAAFPYSLSSRIKTACVFLSLGIIFIYFSWVMYWQELNPYKCALFSLGSAPICIDGPLPHGIILFLICIVLFFAILGVACFYALINVFKEKSILLDDDGIWPAYKPKNEWLISWNDLKLLKSTNLSQIYQQNNFKILSKDNCRSIQPVFLQNTHKFKEYIFDRRSDLIENHDTSRKLFERPLFSRAKDFLIIGILLLCCAFAILFPVEESLISNYIFLVIIMLTFGYLLTLYPILLDLEDNQIILKYYFQTKHISYDQISSVNLTAQGDVSLSLKDTDKIIVINCKSLKVNAEALRNSILKSGSLTRY